VFGFSLEVRLWDEQREIGIPRADGLDPPVHLDPGI